MRCIVIEIQLRLVQKKTWKIEATLTGEKNWSLAYSNPDNLMMIMILHWMPATLNPIQNAQPIAENKKNLLG